MEIPCNDDVDAPERLIVMCRRITALLGKQQPQCTFTLWRLGFRTLNPKQRLFGLGSTAQGLSLGQRDLGFGV